MRIGIDAKSFFSGPVSTTVVLQNLLPELLRLYPENEWILFLNRNDKHLEIPFKGKNIHTYYIWAGMNMLSNVFVVPSFAKKMKVDVMVFQTFPSWQGKIPGIAFIHDVLFRDYPQFFTWKERLYFKPLLFLTRRATRLTATTKFVANKLVDYNYTNSRSKIDIVPLAVSPKFKPVEKFNKGDLKTIKEKFKLPDEFLLFVGRLNVRKNIETLFKALPLLENKTIPLVIVGEPDWKTSDLQQMISLPELRNRILITGRMSDEELIATYALSKIFCFPSFAEGFGLPPLEAMASGIPAVVSRSTSFPEVCGDAAVYVNPTQAESIAQAINSLLGDAQLYSQKKQKGFVRAAKYTWELSAHAMMQSILKATNKKRIE
jgi:glycosyltransferase involved in cell wall biosynthesis